jgi:pimeloyl-[acyl-carrier protein] methyl ester esterase
LIRGILSASYHWWLFDKRLAERFPNAKVTCVDLLGNGTLHTHDTPLDMLKNIEALKQQTMTAGKKILVGFSLGGIVAAEWAQLDRNEIAAIVLINSSSRESRFFQRLRPTSWWPIFKIPFIPDQHARERHSISITSKMLGTETLEQVAIEWAEGNRRYPMNPVNFLRQAYLGSNAKRIAHAPCPMLVLSSKNDRVTNSICSQRLAKKLSLSHHEHGEAGHDLTLDDPDWVIAKIADFLEHSVVSNLPSNSEIRRPEIRR